jgi:hypothetical protein
MDQKAVDAGDDVTPFDFAQGSLGKANPVRA